MTNNEKVELPLSVKACNEVFFPEKPTKLEIIQPWYESVDYGPFKYIIVDMALFEYKTRNCLHKLPLSLYGESMQRSCRLRDQFRDTGRMQAPVINLSMHEFSDGRHRFWFLSQMKIRKFIAAVKKKHWHLISKTDYVLECSKEQELPSLNK